MGISNGKITLDEFLERAPITLASFVEATRRLAVEDNSMNPNTPRPEDWWWRDVSCYLQCVDMDESLKQCGKKGL